MSDERLRLLIYGTSIRGVFTANLRRTGALFGALHSQCKADFKLSFLPLSRLRTVDGGIPPSCALSHHIRLLLYCQIIKSTGEVNHPFMGGFADCRIDFK
jgi:hypothetical protein